MVIKASDTPFGLTEDEIAAVHSVDGAAKTLPVTEEDVSAVLFDYDSGKDWDGDCCAVVELKDGRLLAWESMWGPTGSGFYEDAYGGDAEIFFAEKGNLSLLVKAALSEDMRRHANIPEVLWKD